MGNLSQCPDIVRFCAVQLRLVCTSANIEHFYKCLPGPRLVGGGMVEGEGGGLNTITGSIVAVPGAALPPVPLCQLRLARPACTAGHGKVYNNKMPNWGARERER